MTFPLSSLNLFVRASDRCQQEKRKTINGDDIIWALETLGFDHYAQLMKVYLQRFKDITKMDKSGYDAGDAGILGYDESSLPGAFIQPHLNQQ